MRAFIAIELPDTIRKSLGDLTNLLRQVPSRASWVRPDRMHLTLRFLGDAAEEHLQVVGDRMRSVCSAVPSFELRVAGLGAFPNLRRPSVVWIGCGPLDPSLAQLQQESEHAAQLAGLQPEPKRFHPHVTLARIKDPRGVDGLVEALRTRETIDAGAFTVAHVSLLSSELTPRGPIYTRIQEFPLK